MFPSDPAIDFVAPPFAGHLFPALDLARRLRDRGFSKLRVLTTAGGRAAVEASRLPFVEILPGQDDAVRAIANTRVAVGSSPLRMWRQVRSNLALMRDLQQQLRDAWIHQRPDLVLADFVVPVAGLTAQSMGIAWWSGMPSPCALETPDGTPAYLGGWSPRPGLVGKIRDWAGRRAVRTFKKASAWLFRHQLEPLGIDGLYREDGTEVIYSPERILAYGLQEFEFHRRWPDAVRFIGPLTAPPPLTGLASKPSEGEVPGGDIRKPGQPEWIAERPTVLVTLGTHLWWAKERAITLLEDVARRMPDTEFHFSRGEMRSNRAERRGNLTLCDSIPYGPELRRYAAAIIHGGTGITYACVESAVPMLVWPHDYDQFDHAARVVHHGLGRRLVPSAGRIVKDLRELMPDVAVRASLQRFQAQTSGSDPVARVTELLRQG